MRNDWGFEERTWQSAKEEMKLILHEVAARRALITYGDLSRRLTTLAIGPHEPAMGAMLGQISKEEDALGRGMLTVIVVHKSSDNQPGNGFYKCADDLGKDTTNRIELWVSELKTVHNCWANKAK